MLYLVGVAMIACHTQLLFWDRKDERDLALL